MSYIASGFTARVYESKMVGYVRKEHRNPDSFSGEKPNHARLIHLLRESCADLPIRVPQLLPSKDYEMERVDTSRPLWIPVSWTKLTEAEHASYKEVVMTCLERLARYEFFMCNVQIYVQPDKSLVMLDFGDIHCVPGGPLLQSHRIFPRSVMKSIIAE
jgi:hypothetical protein